MRGCTRAPLVQIHQDMGGNCLGPLPFDLIWLASKRAVTCKCKLAACCSCRALKNHFANRVGITMVGNTVHNNFSDSEFTLGPLIAVFVIDSLR